MPIIYKECDPFQEGIARVQLGDKYGYINTKGEIVIPIKYEWIISLSANTTSTSE